MAFDFPNSPTVGQTYPAAPVSGQPTYTWDGQKWVGTVAGPATTPPLMDGVAAVGVSVNYTRADHVHPSDTSRVAKIGDTMTGLLTLSGAPTAPLHAASKAYVDASTPTGFLPLAGGTMTGQLNTAGSGTSGISGASAAKGLVVFNTPGVGHAYMTFYDAGYFVANFGLANDGNFYMGGVSFGAAAYKFYTTRDGGMVSNGRLALAGDWSGSGEPYAGAVVTGGLGFGYDYASNPYLNLRYRYMQLYTTGWFTVGYA